MDKELDMCPNQVVAFIGKPSRELTKDGIIRKFWAYDDRTLRSDISGNDLEMAKIVRHHFHCG